MRQIIEDWFYKLKRIPTPKPFETPQPPPDRTWRYPCEMSELETYEAFCELTATRWHFRELRIAGMIRPPIGYKNVMIGEADFKVPKLSFQMMDSGMVVMNTNVTELDLFDSIEFFPHKLLEFYQSINVQCAEKNYTHN